jgi:hypothetical protein
MSSLQSDVDEFYRKLNEYRLLNDAARFKANDESSTKSVFALIASCERLAFHKDWNTLSESKRVDVLSIARNTTTRVPNTTENKNL